MKNNNIWLINRTYEQCVLYSIKFLTWSILSDLWEHGENMQWYHLQGPLLHCFGFSYIINIVLVTAHLTYSEYSLVNIKWDFNNQSLKIPSIVLHIPIRCFVQLPTLHFYLKVLVDFFLKCTQQSIQYPGTISLVPAAKFTFVKVYILVIYE